MFTDLMLERFRREASRAKHSLASTTKDDMPRSLARRGVLLTFLAVVADRVVAANPTLKSTGFGKVEERKKTDR